MSDVAKKAAGTYVPDPASDLPPVLAWLTGQCRQGVLTQMVQEFCEAQPENVELNRVVVETVNEHLLRCRIPCRCSDHESTSTFDYDVRFSLDLKNGKCHRL